jgi:pimeloyl-ACP methyl ester carboxylesterase
MALEWNMPFETRWHEFETLSERRLVVRFDPRGAGLSDRGVADISLGARCRDIDAVADRLGLQRFALQGHLHSGSWAIAYAAANPERVSHLILVQAYPNGREHWAAPARAALLPLARLDWTTYTEASMSSAFAWAPGELPRALAAQMRASMTQEDFLALLDFEQQCDVAPLLSQVQCPLLVTHFELNAVTTPDTARRLASTAPKGRLFLPRDFPESLRGFNDFLDEGQAEEGETGVANTLGGSLRIYLVANATTRPGAAEFMVAQHGGIPVSSIGGTTTCLFDSVGAAMACARALAQAVSAGVGVHAGEPGEEPRDHADPALVTAVLAAGMATAGQVIVSNVVRELAAGKGYSFAAMDEGAPGEEEEPIRLFALG